MEKQRGLPTRKTNRLAGFDYATNGTYFITICTKDKRHTLSEIKSPSTVTEAPTPQLTPLGKAAEEAIQEVSLHYQAACVVHYVIMPNHIHMLLEIETKAEDGSKQNIKPISVASIVGQLKRAVSLYAGTGVWQKGYYDHVIRDEHDFQIRWKYIDDNPAKWADDEYYVPKCASN